MFDLANPLSVTSISSVDGNFCTFEGVDGSRIMIYDAGVRYPVNPPQAQLFGSCQAI